MRKLSYLNDSYGGFDIDSFNFGDYINLNGELDVIDSLHLLPLLNDLVRGPNVSLILNYIKYIYTFIIILMLYMVNKMVQLIL